MPRVSGFFVAASTRPRHLENLLSGVSRARDLRAPVPPGVLCREGAGVRDLLGKDWDQELVSIREDLTAKAAPRTQLLLWVRALGSL